MKTIPDLVLRTVGVVGIWLHEDESWRSPSVEDLLDDWVLVSC